MQRLATFALAALVGAGSLAACGTGAEPGVPVAAAPATPAAPSPAEVPDGTHTAWLAAIDGRQLSLELVDVLSGAEAVAAARADGLQVEGGSMPNDVYVRPIHDGEHQVRHVIEVADDATVALLDCSTGCRSVQVPISDLLDGTRRPYGGDRPLVAVEVDAGVVTELVEQYLP